MESSHIFKVLIFFLCCTLFLSCINLNEEIELNHSNKVTGVTLDLYSITLTKGSSRTLNATISPSDATMKELTWDSSKRSVATVDNQGKVTAVNAGTATITVVTADGFFTASCNVKVVSSEPVAPEMIDLGLPVRWASFNLGASFPEDYGDYYAWGETETHYQAGYANSVNPVWRDGYSDGYEWASYKWCRGSFDSLTKYNSDPAFGDVDNKNWLDSQDDVAQVKLGGKWRMPTSSEFAELVNNCTGEMTVLNGVKGCKFTSKIPGYTNNWIFLPNGGYCGGIGWEYEGTYGDYWTSSLYGGNRYAISYHVGEGLDPDNRYWGYCIRPVYGDIVRVSGIRLDTSNLFMTEGSLHTLIATVSPSNATNKNLKWISNNPYVVSVNNQGKVTAVNVGYATITVITDDGGKAASCEVMVDPS